MARGDARDLRQRFRGEGAPAEAARKAARLRIDERKAFPLRRAFQSGTRAYTIATDVAMFEPEMERLAARLQERPPD